MYHYILIYIIYMHTQMHINSKQILKASIKIAAM